MKKLIILLLTVSICTSLSQSWEKVNYFANFYNDFFESENFVFNQNNYGIHIAKKVDMNFNSYLLYPPSPGKIGISKYSVFNDSTILVILSVTNDTSTILNKRMFKSKPDMSGWIDMGIDLNNETSFDRAILIDDTTFIGVNFDTKLNNNSGNIVKHNLVNNKWVKTFSIYPFDTNNVFPYSFDNNKKGIINLADRMGNFVKYNIYKNQFDTLDYQLFLINNDAFIPLYTAEENDTIYFFCKGIVDENNIYLLKYYDNKMAIISTVPYKYNFVNPNLIFLYKNGRFVIIDEVNKKAAYSINHGKSWNYDLTLPSEVFNNDNIGAINALLTSNGYLFVKKTYGMPNAYYTKLKDPTSVEEVVQDNPIYNTTSLELYDILGRSIVTFPSYEKLKAEIENYPPPHLIKWRDEKGIFHFEKMK